MTHARCSTRKQGYRSVQPSKSREAEAQKYATHYPKRKPPTEERRATAIATQPIGVPLIWKLILDALFLASFLALDAAGVYAWAYRLPDDDVGLEER